MESFQQSVEKISVTRRCQRDRLRYAERNWLALEMDVRDGDGDVSGCFERPVLLVPDMLNRDC